MLTLHNLRISIYGVKNSLIQMQRIYQVHPSQLEYQQKDCSGVILNFGKLARKKETHQKTPEISNFERKESRKELF